MPVYALGNRVPEIDPSAFVHPDAVVIGKVHIAQQASIWPGAVLRGDYGEIFVGARTSVQDGSGPVRSCCTGPSCAAGAQR